MKRPRSYEKYDKKGNRFGGSKAPKNPISTGEEYIVTIEEMGKEGSGIAKLRGISIFVNNTNPGDKVIIRITKITRSYADSKKVQSTADETAEKCSKIMETYLGEDPDTQEALEFLCLAEGGEVTHYEVLSSIAKDVTNKKFGARVRSILKEEQGHLELCTNLAKSNASAG